VRNSAIAGPRLTDEETAQKRAIYESIKPNRRKFIDKLGYDNWDPFQKPFEPIDMRLDPTKRTSGQLMDDFLKSLPQGEPVGTDFAKGAWEMSVGVVNGSERFRGMLAFCIWYAGLPDQADGPLDTNEQPTSGK
jgi:hypothetical protein